MRKAGEGMQEREKKIKELLQKAEEGVQGVFESESFQNYLKIMAKFHDYSARNVQLIISQKPNASYVAGYQKWKKELKRIVKKGEKGIAIVAYTPQTRYDEVPKLNAEGKPVLDTDGKLVYTLKKTTKPAFSIKYVFDISQTEGEPLPTLPDRLEGTVENYGQILESVKSLSNFKIEFQKIEGNAMGVCNLKEKRIVIDRDMSELQSISVLIHEIAHERLHGVAERETTDRQTREVEAEATAYVVCEYLGLDTSEVAFPYIASWSKEKDTKTLYQSLDRIQKNAHEMICSYEEHMKGQEKEQDPEKAPEQKRKVRKRQSEIER